MTVLLTAGSAFAQETANDAQRATGKPNDATGQTSPTNQGNVQTNDQASPQAGGQGRSAQDYGLDQQIAGCLLLSNQAEVALAQFAKEKCESDKCKDFADMMIEEHQEAIAKIEQAAPQIASMGLMLRNAKSGENNGEQDKNNQNGGQAGGMAPGMLLARQVKEECLAATTKALGEKEGAEFDKHYLGQQVMAHMTMVAELKGSEPFASAQLKPVIKESMQTAEKHLEKAKELMSQIKDKDKDENRQASASN